MRQKLYFFILAAEMVVCVVLVVLQASMTGIFSAVMAFPFEQIGMGLRALSLSGAAGNIAAIALYVLICLAPCGALLVRRKRVLYLEDGLVVLLSVTLLAVLYMMINPGLAGSLLSSGNVGLPIAKAFFGCTVYSILFAYIILRALRLFFSNGIEKLQKYMTVVLGLLNVLFVYLVFGAGMSGLLDSFAALKAGNTGNEHLLGASYVFLILRYVVDVLPYALDIIVVFTGLNLLREMAANRYSEGSVAAAEKLSKLCGIALTVTVLSNMTLNLLQLVFAKMLLIVNSYVQLPLFSIAFLLAALLLARLVAENKALKDDNNSII